LKPVISNFTGNWLTDNRITTFTTTTTTTTTTATTTATATTTNN